MVHESVEGQAMELGRVHDGVCVLDEPDCLSMILKKTCWYTSIQPCRIGALVATGGAADPERFNRFGDQMGAAVQIQDDILNLVAGAKRYGEEIDGDSWEGKRTLMLMHAYRHANVREQRRIERYLAAPCEFVLLHGDRPDSMDKRFIESVVLEMIERQDGGTASRAATCSPSSAALPATPTPTLQRTDSAGWRAIVAILSSTAPRAYPLRTSPAPVVAVDGCPDAATACREVTAPLRRTALRSDPCSSTELPAPRETSVPFQRRRPSHRPLRRPTATPAAQRPAVIRSGKGRTAARRGSRFNLPTQGRPSRRMLAAIRCKPMLGLAAQPHGMFKVWARCE
ncbi:polyprenyl synthetase family protein [uncultured Piscinibacter sp.]|uniref:polyprenyl synthetase family protein n=1 Tax=uncultured Piscinibacter sp. TaxID=1131835 RepID=UPI0026228369|nr:polyprenyl synthetase family protein [uncultured Piscinibacter sp.]